MTADFGVKVRVLVVDDVPSARRITVRFLQKIGVKDIVEAEGVADAVAKLEADYFNLFVCDVHLKDGKGPEVLQKISEQKKKDLKSIFITSDMDKTTFMEAMEQGVTTYLLKPFSAEILSNTIMELFRPA